ncbi:MAG: hypothetical protein ABIY52_00685 [Gemmatimonadaceae bacterium]
MTRLSRCLLAAAFLPLAACNVQISSPDGIYTEGDTRLPAPSSIVTVALDGAVHLSWSGTLASSYQGEFKHFRVYSTAYSFSGGRCDDGGWVVEGTTVSDAFLVGNLRNGQSLCFAVSTVARDGGEGSRSRSVVETPRFSTVLGF